MTTKEVCVSLCSLIVFFVGPYVVCGADDIQSPNNTAVYGRLFDEYGLLSKKNENRRLDNLAAQIKKEPKSRGFVVIYEGSSDRIRDLESRACRALRRVTLVNRVHPNQITTMLITGGHRERFSVELWVWPIEAPDDLPRFQLGVIESQVVVLRGTELRSRCCAK